MYSTNIRPESEIRGSLPLINPEPEGRGVYQWHTKGEGFISGKLPLTLDSGRIFVEYTVVAVVYTIYTMAISHKHSKTL